MPVVLLRYKLLDAWRKVPLHLSIHLLLEAHHLQISKNPRT
jgi:hypothetical protein